MSEGSEFQIVVAATEKARPASINRVMWTSKKAHGDKDSINIRMLISQKQYHYHITIPYHIK